jgi:manganese/zinc/iron transport system permease protein
MTPQLDMLTTIKTILLDEWFLLDTWIVVTAALAAMGCAIPGTFLVLRRQSMMGDALTHTVLPGIVGAFIISHAMKTSGWFAATGGEQPYAFDAITYTMMFVGAVAIGALTAVLSEWVQRQGRVESSAALGIVYTSLFAVGLLMIRLFADSVHIDPDCVLYGSVETVWVTGDGVPRAALASGGALVLNTLLVVAFFKELRVSTFDPDLATSLGINSTAIHYGLMAITAVTAVAAFESVGNILVIAMLIVPPATAHLLTDRLWLLIVLSVTVAAASAWLGHAFALILPTLLLTPFADAPLLRSVNITSLDASTAGMMATTSGLLFLLALLLGPRHGLVIRRLHRGFLAIRIAAEDLLGVIYRNQEDPETVNPAILTDRSLTRRLAVWWLRRRGLVTGSSTSPVLTSSGHASARQLVRAHRLWESYMAHHFKVPADHLHEMAHRVEHFLDPELRDQIAEELDGPQRDPHGREIPLDEPD